jgi:hypothetical protein
MGNFIAKLCPDENTEVFVVHITPEEQHVEEQQQQQQEEKKDGIISVDSNLSQDNGLIHRHASASASLYENDRNEEQACMHTQKGHIRYYRSHGSSLSLNDYAKYSFFRQNVANRPSYERCVLQTLITQNCAYNNIKKGDTNNAKKLLRDNLGWNSEEAKEWVERSSRSSSPVEEKHPSKP